MKWLITEIIIFMVYLARIVNEVIDELEAKRNGGKYDRP